MTPGEVYIVVMVSVIVLLVLVLFVMLELKIGRLMRKLDEISENANEFVKMGLKYFKNR